MQDALFEMTMHGSCIWERLEQNYLILPSSRILAYSLRSIRFTQECLINTAKDVVRLLWQVRERLCTIGDARLMSNGYVCEFLHCLEEEILVKLRIRMSMSRGIRWSHHVR